MMFRRFIDAHCHLQDSKIQSRLVEVLKHASKHGLTHICSCSCNEVEWADYPNFEESITSQGVQIVPSFGLHPWYAESASSTYLETLRGVLERYPFASIGEIGLCKSRRGKQVPIDIQEIRFREQLNLAQDIQRPVVIHCVGAHGKALEILSKAQVPHAIMHSFSGSVDMVYAYLRCPYPIFFSFTSKQCINMTNKIQQIIQAVPNDRLLIETDAPDQMPVAIANNDNLNAILETLPHNEPYLVQYAIDSLSACKGMPPHALAEQVYVNSLHAFQLPG